MMTFNKWEHHPRHTKCSNEADQLEWQASIIGPSPLDASQMDDGITGAIDEVQSSKESAAVAQVSPNPTVSSAIQNNLRAFTEERDKAEKRSEDLSAGTVNEIERRQKLLGDHYPFEIQAGSLHFRGQDTPGHKAYMDCLRTSVDPTPADREAFEHLVVKALGIYLGNRSTSQLFGWQSKKVSDQPRRIKAMMESLHQKTGEWCWNPESALPDDPPTTLVKDLGMDAVAWLPMPDGRWGKLLLIAQCATGKTDWEDKLGDVNWDKIESWIRPTPHRWGIRCFAIPFHLPNEMKWREASKRGGLFLDRARLTLLLKDSESIAAQPPRTMAAAPHSQSPENAPQPCAR